MFNMAHMGLRLAQRANGVSQLHGAVSRGMFGSLWEGFDADEVPIGSVTNGVHGPTWEAREVTALIGEPGRRRTAARRCPTSELWALRGMLRARLVAEVRRRVREAWLQRGASTPELGWTDHVFDPEVLTVGFARRVPTYKRLTLMLRDKDRLRDLLLDPHRPVQLVVAGKSHPADDGGKALIQEIVRFADDPAVRHRIVFLPDYDMSMARYLYWGCDVWLNNPLRPLEACGTSGHEVGAQRRAQPVHPGRLVGRALRRRQRLGHPHRGRHRGPGPPRRPGGQRALRAAGHPGRRRRSTSAPTGVPARWVELVRHTLTTLRPQVQATRMVREYVEDWYAPAARAAARDRRRRLRAGPRAGRLPGPAERGLAAGGGGRGGRVRAAGHARGRAPR